MAESPSGEPIQRTAPTKLDESRGMVLDPSVPVVTVSTAPTEPAQPPAASAASEE
jgi:hypothetical protein